jgi:hypothetical protein
MKNTRCEQLINDAFTVFDDLEKTDRFSDLMDFWICRVKEDVQKVNWVQDVLPTMDTMRYHVATSLTRLNRLEEAVNTETTGSGGWSESSNGRRIWFRSAASRHHRLFNIILGANEQYLEVAARQAFRPAN